MSGNIRVYEACDGMRHHCIYTAVCACMCVSILLHYSLDIVYIHTIVTVQKTVGNKGCRCGRLFSPPHPCEGAQGEMERLNPVVWSDATGLHYLYLLICLALS